MSQVTIVQLQSLTIRTASIVISVVNIAVSSRKSVRIVLFATIIVLIFISFLVVAKFQDRDVFLFQNEFLKFILSL